MKRAQHKSKVKQQRFPSRRSWADTYTDRRLTISEIPPLLLLEIAQELGAEGRHSFSYFLYWGKKPQKPFGLQCTWGNGGQCRGTSGKDWGTKMPRSLFSPHTHLTSLKFHQLWAFSLLLRSLFNILCVFNLHFYVHLAPSSAYKWMAWRGQREAVRDSCFHCRRAQTFFKKSGQDQSAAAIWEFTD